MRTRTRKNEWKAIGILLFLWGCGALENDSLSGDRNSSPDAGGVYDPQQGSDRGQDEAVQDFDDADALPPEQEHALDFEQPRAGARFVFVANPRRDTVAVIDPGPLSIRTVEVGDAPSFLATLPGQDVALVINAGTRDLSILRMGPTGATVSTVSLVPGVNRLAVAPDGGHAIAWHDARIDQGLGSSGSFQDVSLIRLAATGDRSFPLTVGFKPSAVHFSNDRKTAFIVTEDGISVVHLAQVMGSTLTPLVRLAAASTGETALDVSITPDGRYALAREEGQSDIVLVDLHDGVRSSVDLGGVVTDLDLGPDGTWALAVLREKSTIVKIPLPLGFQDPDAIESIEITAQAVGQATITPDGKTAVLHTTAGAVTQVVVVDIDGGMPPTPIRLRKTVRAVAIAPDSQTALLLHDKAPGNPNQPGLDVDERISRSFGYTLLNLETGFAKLQLTDVDPTSMAITPDGSHAFMLLRNDATSLRIAQRVNLQSFLIDDFVLGSPPISVAALATESQQVFVSQLHPSGRISFINWMTGDLKSVTGFELNGGILE